MKFTININGKPITKPDGVVQEFSDYSIANMNFKMCENKGDDVRIICHDLDDIYQPYFRAFLKAHPKGTKGNTHYVKWILDKRAEFKEVHGQEPPIDKEKHDAYNRLFLRWLNEKIETQQKLEI